MTDVNLQSTQASGVLYYDFQLMKGQLDGLEISTSINDKLNDIIIDVNNNTAINSQPTMLYLDSTGTELNISGNQTKYKEIIIPASDLTYLNYITADTLLYYHTKSDYYDNTTGGDIKFQIYFKETSGSYGTAELDEYFSEFKKNSNDAGNIELEYKEMVNINWSHQLTTGEKTNGITIKLVVDCTYLSSSHYIDTSQKQVSVKGLI